MKSFAFNLLGFNCMYNRQVIDFKFSLPWSFVSPTRVTTSSGWKLFRFDKIEVNDFEILLINVMFYVLGVNLLIR